MLDVRTGGGSIGCRPESGDSWYGERSGTSKNGAATYIPVGL